LHVKHLYSDSVYTLQICNWCVYVVFV